MNPKFTMSFQVRYYECDAYNHVNHANYVRYMSEAAFGAAAAVGYGQDYLDNSGHVWLAREHDIEFIRPLTYGDVVHIDTWVADFRRVRSLRKYDFWRGEELVARASTDWVFINTSTQQLAFVPPEVAAAFEAKNGILEETTRQDFPKPAPYAPEVFTGYYPVEWRDIDPQFHVNNAAYLAYIENCNIDVCAHYGWPMDRMAAEGIGIIARRYQIEYRRPAVLGDTLKISTWVSDRRGASAIRHHEIRRAADDLLLVRSRVKWVWINLQTGAPIRIPKPFLEAFADNFTEE